MNTACGKEWTRHMLIQAFTNKFVCGPWTKHREQVLFEREKALLPDTLIHMNEEKRKKSLYQDKYVIPHNTLMNEWKENEQFLHGKIDSTDRNYLKRRQVELLNQIRYLERNRALIQRNIDSGIYERNQNRLIRACPVSDCRGFLNTEWKCELCDMYTCLKCHVVKYDKEHCCLPDDIATAKLLSTDTKPCPKCAIGIFKIDGCDQMWCTQCHTAFSWKSGLIETTIHNPHYYEFMRRTNREIPRVIGDQICEEQVIDHLFWLDFASLFVDQEDISDVENIVRSLIHLRLIQVPNYQQNHENNRELREKYLTNHLSETEFKVRIQRSNKMHEKKKEIYEILTLFIQSMTDILFRLYYQLLRKNNSLTKTNHVMSHLQEVETIRLYANECLEEIARVYKNKPLYIVFFASNHTTFQNVLV